MGTDDRDHNKPKHPRLATSQGPGATPARGVGVGDEVRPPSDENWDPDTGVKQQAYQDRPTSHTARAAFRKIDELGRKFDDHAKADESHLEKIHETLKGQDTMLTTIRIEQAKVGVAVENVNNELRHQRDLQKIEAQGEQAKGVEKQKTETERMSGRTKVILALIAVLATIAGAFGKWLVG